MTAHPEPTLRGEPTRLDRPLTRLDDLAGRGLIDAGAMAALQPVVDRFQLRLTASLADMIDPANPDDPVARQFVPGTAELEIAAHELADPIGDDVHETVPGITHRYPDRVLLKPTHLCQVYCRFCFRREKVGQGEETLDAAELAAAIAYIAARPDIFEVILTGGDPLILSDRRLAAILDGLEAIGHVAVVRLHTRAIVADPGRVTDDFVRLLRRASFATWVALHVNHPDELTPDVTRAIARLVDGGIPLVSQTVLLAGVNDRAETLARLMRGLVARRVKPYYLHHLDLAAGTSHFRTSLARGVELASGLRGAVSGLCQPTYVLDLPGGHGKVPIAPGLAQADVGPGGAPGTYRFRDWRGVDHDYIDPAAT